MASNFSSDLIVTLSLLGFTAIVAAAYTYRVKKWGRAQNARVDKQGESALLKKEAMEGAFWFLGPIARLVIFLGITANMVSWTSFALGLLAGICLAFGHFGSAAFFASFCALFDALDGIVARLTDNCSDAGEVLDASIDRAVEFFFLAGLAYYYREIPALLLLVLVTFFGSFMVSYSSAKAEALNVNPPKGSMRRPERALYLILGAVLSPVTIWAWERGRDYPVAIGHPMVLALGLVGVLSTVSAVERLWSIARQVRAREVLARVKASKKGSQEVGASEREVSDSLLPKI
ncbi:CDP-alcohol phosphatidyltransferase family protein [Bdellovibrionota bacterium FG-2]